jgi:hypothetical protein
VDLKLTALQFYHVAVSLHENEIKVTQVSSLDALLISPVLPSSLFFVWHKNLLTLSLSVGDATVAASHSTLHIIALH